MATLYHYTSEAGLRGILATQRLWPSLLALNPNDARYGDGQYFSDIPPGTKTPGQLAYLFLNDPRGWRRFTHFVEVDLEGFQPLEGRPGVFVVLSTTDFDLAQHVVRFGSNTVF